jgi:hypothetical protein
MAAGGAVIGAQFGGPYGAAIGGAVGAIGGIVTSLENITEGFKDVTGQRSDKELKEAAEFQKIALYKEQQAQRNQELEKVKILAQMTMPAIQGRVAGAKANLGAKVGTSIKSVGLDAQQAQDARIDSQKKVIQETESQMIGLMNKRGGEQDPKMQAQLDREIEEKKEKTLKEKKVLYEMQRMNDVIETINDAANTQVAAIRTQRETQLRSLEFYGNLDSNNSKGTLDSVFKGIDEESNKYKEAKEARDKAIQDRHAKETAENNSMGNASVRIQKQKDSDLRRDTEMAASARTFADDNIRLFQDMFKTMGIVSQAGTQSLTVKMTQNERKLTDERIALAEAKGMGPKGIGGLLDQAAMLAASEAAEVLNTEMRDIAATERAYAELKKRMQTEGATADQMAAAELERNNKLAERRAETLRKESEAAQAAVRAITERVSREQDVLSVESTRIQSMKDINTAMGGSMANEMALNKHSIDLKRQNLELELSRLEQLKKAGQEFSQEGLASQKAVYQMQADLVKSQMGVQRDFIDKAVGRGFGMGQGSKFQPILGDRMMLGEYSEFGGMKRKGSMSEVDQRMAAASLGLGGGTSARPDFSPSGAPTLSGPGGNMPGAPDFRGPKPSASPTTPATPTFSEVKGEFSITVSLDPESLKSAIKQQIQLSVKSGEIAPGKRG